MKSKIRFYFSMASLIDAGLPVTKALRQPHPASLKSITRLLADDIEAGQGQLNELMQNHPGIFSDFECKIIKVGEETGHLENSFKALAEYFQERRELTTNLISGFAYPILVFHVAAVLIPFISFITGACSVTGMVIRILLALGIPYSLTIAFFLYLCLAKHKQISPPVFLSKFCLSSPLIGSVIRKLNYARFFNAYSIAIQSGLNAVEAVILATGSCNNTWIHNSFLRTADEIKNQGCPFSEALKRNIYPNDRESIAVQIMESGETAGKGDESAAKIAEIYRGESQSAMKLLVSIVPKLVYLAMAIYIGWTIIRFYSRLFSQTTSLL